MAGKNSQDWKLNLDIVEFTKNALHAKGTLESLGNAKNLTGLVEGLMSAGKLLGIVGTAAFALKTTFDMVFEAEEIKSINSQFELLAKNAGVAGEALKEKLVGATEGLADDTDILKAANEQIVKLGSNSSKLPEIMSLARKQTAAFGGDLIQRFESLSTAIANGNTRMLKHVGINIDATKAYKEYAASVGKTVGALSQEERQRAVLNAVLKKGNDALRGVSDSNREATLGWQRFMTTLNQLKEAFVLAFDRTMSPAVRRLIGAMETVAGVTGKWLKDHFGSDADQAIAKSKQLSYAINETNIKINEAKIAAKEGGIWNKILYGAGGPEAAIEGLTKSRDEMIKRRQELDAIAAKSKPTGGGDLTDNGPTIDAAAMKEERTKLENDLLSIKKDRLQKELELSQAYIDEDGKLQYQADAIIAEQMTLIEEEKQNKIREINEKYKGDVPLKNEMIMEVERNAAYEKIELEEKVAAAREKNLDKYLEHSKTASDGSMRGWQVSAAKTREEYNKNEKSGINSQKRIEKASIDAFHKIGAGHATLAQATKSLVMNEAADRADAKGKVLFLEGIASMQPQMAAGGAALMALAGALRGAAGGGGGGEGGSVGGVGGGSGGASTMEQEKPQMKVAEKKAVSINIQGSYYETEQTRTRLMEMIRESGDYTDFNLKQIGQK